MGKRQLDFRTGDDVIKEITLLAREGYMRTGNWTLTQICEHLDKTIVLGMKGAETRLPWILRATIGRWFIASSLRKNRLPSFRMQTIKELEPGPIDLENEDQSVIGHCMASIEEAKRFAGPLRNYPLANNVRVDDWRRLQWIHAAHHLGFLLPRPN